jgi:hypothetical protein
LEIKYELLFQARDAASLVDFHGLEGLADTLDVVALAHIHGLMVLADTLDVVALAHIHGLMVLADTLDVVALAHIHGLMVLTDTLDAVALAHTPDLRVLGSIHPGVVNALVELLAFDKMGKWFEIPEFLGEPMELNEIDILGVLLGIGGCCHLYHHPWAYHHHWS